jgi:addiction module RelB/DinJ family antitoxin
MYTTLLIKLDKKLKAEAQKMAKSMGLPLSTVVNGYLNKFITDRSITFEVPVLKPKVWKALQDSHRDYKVGKNTSPQFTNAKDAIAWLDRAKK